MDIYAFLEEHQIPYQRADHPPVFTCEQAMALVPKDLPGGETKNLFVKDKKGRVHFLVVVGYDKSVDLKALSDILGSPRLSLASPERLQKYLGVEPGSVSLLGIVNDAESAVEVIMDQAVWNHDALRCHPLVNTATLVIKREDIERLFQITNHKFRVIEVPGRAE